MTEDSTPVRADVPLDYHPDSLLGVASALNEPDTLGTSALAAAREALRLVYDGIGRLADAERDLQAIADPAVRRQHPAAKGGRSQMTDNVRMIDGTPTRVVDAEEFIKAAERAMDRIAPAIDRRVRELRGYRDKLASRVESALDHPHRRTPEGLSLAAEVRAHIKGMTKPEERLSFIHKAVARDDRTTVAAVIHAPPFLSGLDDETHGTIRQRAASTFAPVDSAQLDATDSALRQVMNAGNALSGRFGRVMQLRQAPAMKAAGSLKALAMVG
ncbi:hypothetical protein [Erythrobacter sp. AP23]|uniref:hypothetical protein n=1 Tax=Erythrobacter sp. AP23 TaxID=499656 RepID=UPI00076C52A3|nr:hypothetical protein [Erythrobacter sp. AP23]KWV95943.1 hypothetical protein ASS64_01600 [Erythrobacter sp. AP23]